MKIAVIGAGSTYTPELGEGLILEAQALGLRELYLHDINAERLKIVGGLVQRMVEAQGNPFVVKCTLDRVEAVAGASFVLTQLRVGGQAARALDTKICLEEGLIGQETTGPVGFAKAMRTIPVLLEICADLQTHAPGAFLINFTNPAGVVTEAVLKHGGVQAIGLCNIPFGLKNSVAQECGVLAEEVDLDYVGLNHLSWVRRIFVAGRDRTGELLVRIAARPANIPGLNIDPQFAEALGMWPNSYLNYFYLQDEMIEHLQAQPRVRGEVVAELEARLLEEYKDPQLRTKPLELSKRGGAHYSTAAVSLIRDIHLNAGRKHIVNVQNQGALPDLPWDGVVEVPCVVDAQGAHPLTMGRLEPQIRGLIQHVKAYEELTVAAAVTKDYHTALLALTSHPLTRSVNKAKRILDRFNEAHQLQLH
ncbi:MAG: 6-phospho-beta-glucosidase [Firmicutes bacterium]|nr:6-phospho-beta-glucosidase [Bacillota bacterium]